MLSSSILGRPQHPLKFAAALFSVTMVAVLSALDQTVVSTALPHIIESLQGSDLLGWIFTAYFLGATATVMVTGKLADLFGRRRVFLTSVVVFSAGSLLCGLSNSMLLLVAFRGVQGIGAGSLQTCSLIIMGDMFSPRERGKWQAINSIGFATASAIGPSIGGILSDTLSWRWIFLVNVPVCLATIAAILYGLAGMPRISKRPEIDWSGGALSMLAVISLLMALTWGGRTYAWLSPEIAALIAIAAVAAVFLWRVERKAPEPIIPGSLLRNRVAVMCGFSAFATMGIWFGLIVLAPLRLQLVLGATATAAGASLTPGIVLSALCSLTSGQVLSRTGRYRVMSLLVGVFDIAGLAMLLATPPISPSLWVSLSFTVVGIGTGFGVMSFMIAFQNGIPIAQLGAGMGLFSLFRQFGSSLGTAVVGSIAGAAAATDNPASIAQSIHQAELVQVIGASAVLALAWFLPDLPLRTSQRDEPPGLAGLSAVELMD